MLKKVKKAIMQTYLFLNKSTGEVVQQQFSCFDHVKKFLKTNENFQLIDEDLKDLPVRGTRVID